MLVDTHVHVISPDEERYPLQPTSLTGPWYRDEPCSLGRLIELMDDAGVDRAVLVQPVSAYGFDNRYTADSARARPDRCTSVACIDPGGADPAAELRAVVESDGMRGLRWWGLAGAGVAEPRSLWDEATALGIPVVVTIFADRLRELAATLEHVRAVPVAVDHCGFADFGAGVPPELAALAEFPNLHLKVSTHVLHDAEQHGDVRDLVADLAARFGANRLMWGSDWSQTHYLPYPDLVEYGRRAASKLADDERDAFLGATAIGMWPELA